MKSLNYMGVTPPPKLAQAQRTALLSQPGPARFKHFISRAADYERLWSLRNASGWVMPADDTGTPGLPVWPHPDYAQACAAGTGAETVPAEIGLYEFMEEWLPDLAARNLLVTVFPTPSMAGIWIKPDDLKKLLTEELKNYE